VAKIVANLVTAVPNSITVFNNAVYVHTSVTNSTLTLTLNLTLSLILMLTLALTLTLIEFGTAVTRYAVSREPTVGPLGGVLERRLGRLGRSV